MTKIPSQVTSRLPDIKKIKSLSTLELFTYETSSDKKIFSIDKSHLADLVPAKTVGAVQRNWYTPSEFPCCPNENEVKPIKAYAEKVVPGSVFSRNQYSTSIVLESVLADANKSILVMCQKAESGGMKPWTIAKITHEDGLYVHEALGSFFDSDGAKKYFCLAQGLEWKGGDTFDDFC